MNLSWILILLSGGGGAALVALINKFKDKGERQRDVAEVLSTITEAFSKTLESVQSSSSRAIEAADANFRMSTEREKRLLEIIRSDDEHKRRTDEKIARFDERFAFLSAVIGKASDCKFLRDKANNECPVIKANLKGQPTTKCDNCEIKPMM